MAGVRLVVAGVVEDLDYDDALLLVDELFAVASPTAHMLALRLEQATMRTTADPFIEVDVNANDVSDVRVVLERLELLDALSQRLRGLRSSLRPELA